MGKKGFHMSNAGKRVAVHYTGTFDDGTVFDPTSVKEDESTDLTSGLHLVRGLVERIFYLRVFNTNNTIMEIDLDKGGKA